jgi:hypothetical protein
MINATLSIWFVATFAIVLSRYKYSFHSLHVNYHDDKYKEGVKNKLLRNKI